MSGKEREREREREREKQTSGGRAKRSEERRSYRGCWVGSCRCCRADRLGSKRGTSRRRCQTPSPPWSSCRRGSWRIGLVDCRTVCETGKQSSVNLLAQFHCYQSSTSEMTYIVSGGALHSTHWHYQSYTFYVQQFNNENEIKTWNTNTALH